jgi:hypothetical protein
MGVVLLIVGSIYKRTGDHTYYHVAVKKQTFADLNYVNYAAVNYCVQPIPKLQSQTLAVVVDIERK